MLYVSEDPHVPEHERPRKPRRFPDRFRVLEQLAANGAEFVVRAFDKKLRREVLLKSLGPRARAHVRGQRAMREAHALARIEHSGVVRLFEVIDEHDGPLLVLEPVAGETLASRLDRQGPLPPAEVRRIGLELCSALDAVHREGIVHRCLSTENVLQRLDGSVCLRGFSLAKSFGRGLSISSIDYHPGEVDAHQPLVPNPAPEQVAGECAEPRSDLFGLGCVLFECLTGKNPFDGSHTAQGAPDPAKYVDGLPPDLCEAIRRSLSPSPLGRYATANRFAAALRNELREERSPRSKRMRARATVLGGAAVLFALWMFLAMTSPPPRSPGGSAPTPPSSQYSSHYDRSYALVIGINYEDTSAYPDLYNAEGDALAVKALLDDLPHYWEVTPLIGAKATREEIFAKIATLRQGMHKDDRLLIYFAGHGESDGASLGYLVPSGARARAKDPGHCDWISFSSIHDWFELIPAKHILMVLDCCFSGRATTPRSGRAATGGAFESKYLTQPARIILSSEVSDDPVTDGVPGQHSPYTGALLRAFAQRDTSCLTASMLHARIQMALQNTNQRPAHVSFPYKGVKAAGDFVFFLEPPKK